MSQQSAIMDEIDKVCSVIATARRLLSDGKMVDLSALEGKVRDLCQMIEGYKTDDLTVVNQAVEAMRKNLDLLEKELTAQYESVEGKPLESDFKQAAGAYGDGDNDDGGANS